MSQENTYYNRKYKDSLFRFIFNNKEAALSLYNAINDSDYQETDAMEFYTMNDFLYMGMKNDLSFLLDWNLNMFEHQSSYNPNMPLRGLIYTSAALKKFIEKNRLDMYSSKLLTIPVPRYYVFYNGLKKAADEVILKLTDSMAGTNASKVSSAEFTAHMININAGHSAQIMERCPLLHQYSLFVAALRKKISDGLSLGDAIEETITECIERTSSPIFYVNTERRLPICYSKNMIVPHTLLPRKRLVMKKGLKMVYVKQNKILLKKRNVLTNFSLP